MKRKTVILIGSEGLIGNNFKNFLLRKDFNVLAVDIKNRQNTNKGNFIYLKKDISKPKTINDAVKIAEKFFFGADYVIDCSYPYMKSRKNLSSKNIKILRKNLAVNITNPIMICEMFCEYFKKKKKIGNIILMGSIQGIMAPKFDHYKKTDMNSPVEYTVLKFGIVGIVKYFAKFYGKNNISINCISPGGILNNQTNIFLKNYKKDCLTKGMLNPSDLNSALDFLMSEDSKMVNGQNIVIDDGWSL